ncbi:MAG: hypothetical protein ACTSYS_13980 [Promethearchaeota archaeon]
MKTRYHYWRIMKFGEKYHALKYIKTGKTRYYHEVRNPLSDAVVQEFSRKVNLKGLEDRMVSILEQGNQFTFCILHPRDNFSKKIARKILQGRFNKKSLNWIFIIRKNDLLN